MKRKFPPDTSSDVIPTSGTAATQPKKQRVGAAPSHMPTTLPMQPHEDVLAELRGKYDVLPLSVISSSSMRKRVERALTHLGRFSPVDMSVLPGVVLLHARAGDARKMISVIELVRRRIHESEQKWFQYNRLYEVTTEAKPQQQHHERSVIEDTVLEQSGRDGNDSGEDEFETMDHPTVFERAVQPQSGPPSKPYMSIFLSRVPIPELQAKDYITAQSNADQIETMIKKKMGLL
ncbi:hypothetical protein NKR23_g887 [Pleurostoma richardsiae]|uniref:DNA/RNA-binding protein Alba-like domain-containing protein n=1 Tax=Pleurostoma richardsiae TaxID=41990 RepID=A0AA38RQH0_9PEZI|nr:hypothetical protein NKR23_g887 [Pleurostoma richardsiae]